MDDNAAVLVTGGGGFLGTKILAGLAKSDRPILCLYRHSKPMEIENIYPVCNDLSSADLLAVPLRGVTTVIHLAWEGSFRDEQLNSQDVKGLNTPNLKALKNLLEACEKSDVDRFIFLSVKGANSESSNLFLKEKYFAEVFVTNSKIREKIVLRSDIIYSKTDSLFLQSLSGLLKLPLMIPVPEKKATFNPVHISDVVKLVLSFVEKPVSQKSLALIRHISSKDSLDSKKLVSALSTSVGVRNKIMVSEPFSRLLMPVLDSRKDKKVRPLKAFSKIGQEQEWSEACSQELLMSFSEGLEV